MTMPHIQLISYQQTIPLCCLLPNNKHLVTLKIYIQSNMILTKRVSFFKHKPQSSNNATRSSILLINTSNVLKCMSETDTRSIWFKNIWLPQVCMKQTVNNIFNETKGLITYRFMWGFFKNFSQATCHFNDFTIVILCLIDLSFMCFISLIKVF